MVVSAAVSDVDSVVALVRRSEIDVVVADVYLANGRSGLEVLQRLDRPSDPRVLFVSGFADGPLAGLIRDRGGSGLVSKSCPPAVLQAAVVAVAQGRTVFSQPARAAVRAPSDREIAVIAHVADGCSNEEIAVLLQLSPRTVASHLRRCFVRYRVSSRTELVLLALDRRWLARRTRPPLPES